MATRGARTRSSLVAMETVLRALADQTRLRILGLLMAGETCVCDIHESLRIPQSKTSRHLAYLRRAGLVDTRREGLWVHYRLAEPADGILRALLDCATHCLTHLPITEGDRERLARVSGTTPAAPETSLPVLSCCGVPIPLRVKRAPAGGPQASGGPTRDGAG